MDPLRVSQRLAQASADERVPPDRSALVASEVHKGRLKVLNNVPLQCEEFVGPAFDMLDHVEDLPGPREHLFPQGNSVDVAVSKATGSSGQQ